MRKTKIICTIGPASENEEVLTQMCKAGMDVARLNFSHGTHEEQQSKIDLIKKVRQQLGIPIAIMLDTKGPEYRIKTFENGKITLQDGDTFTLTTDDIVGNQERVAVNYKNLIEELKVGDRVLVNNGLIILEVTELKGADAICKVIAGGVLSDRKSMNFPNKVMTHAYLSEQDQQDLLFGIQNDVDFVAASFVSTRQDVADVRNFLDANGGSDIDIIAKIENRAGVENVDEICEIANGIMIARGDLGVEIPGMEVPAIQKYLINKCRMLGTRVITATEMLESMIHNPRPTRAELSDVANAVYDGSSAIMLSGESAAGKYPVDAVRNMAEIAAYTESQINYTKRFQSFDFEIQSILDAISHSTCAMAVDVKAKCIVVSTLSGTTARMVSRFRCPVDIIGMTTSEKVWRKLNLSWGVTPVLCEEFSSMEVMFYHAINEAKQILNLQKDDTVVLTGGLINGQVGNTNVIKVETVK
jgi:pyruvate kinase